MVPCKSTAEEVSFEWSHHRISSTDSKVRTTLHVSIIDSGSERDKTQVPFKVPPFLGLEVGYVIDCYALVVTMMYREIDIQPRNKHIVNARLHI